MSSVSVCVMWFIVYILCFILVYNNANNIYNNINNPTNNIFKAFHPHNPNRNTALAAPSRRDVAGMSGKMGGSYIQ